MKFLKVQTMKANNYLLIWLFGAGLALAACGGGGNTETKGGQDADPKPTTKADKSCPAGTLRAADNSCTPECKKDEVRNSTGVCEQKNPLVADTYCYIHISTGDTEHEEICQTCYSDRNTGEEKYCDEQVITPIPD